MLCRVALVSTDVSEERSASKIRVTSIGELGTTLAVTSKATNAVNNFNFSISPRLVLVPARVHGLFPWR
jgi:hypothetical protein